MSKESNKPSDELYPQSITSIKTLRSRLNEILLYGKALHSQRNNLNQSIAGQDVSDVPAILKEIIVRAGNILHTMVRRSIEAEQTYAELTKVFHAVKDAKTIHEALILLEKAFAEFKDSPLRIQLALWKDSSGVFPNMLIDSIELYAKRLRDMNHNSPLPTFDLQNITHLFSVVDWTVSDDVDLTHIVNVLDEESYTSFVPEWAQYSTAKFDVHRYPDPKVFWENIGSMLSHKLNDIWVISFISEDPEKFSGDIDTTILKEELEKIVVLLNKIASYEENSRDTLTKLPTRKYLLQQIDKLFNQAQELETHLNVVIVDLDKFKSINDTYWHSAGDFVLSTFADILSSKLSSSDVKVRYGGEEFAIVSLASPENAYAAMKRVSEIFQSFTFGIDGNWVNYICKSGGDTLPRGIRKYNLSFSAWIESISPDEIRALKDAHKTVFAQMIKKADDRLYISKEHGRKHIVSKESEARIMKLPVSA